MTEIKPYSKAWLRVLVSKSREVQDKNPALTLQLLLNDLDQYIAHLDAVDHKRGKGMSPAKYAAILVNSKKGGWKKGRPRKVVGPESEQ